MIRQDAASVLEALGDRLGEAAKQRRTHFFLAVRLPKSLPQHFSQTCPRPGPGTWQRSSTSGRNRIVLPLDLVGHGNMDLEEKPNAAEALRCAEAARKAHRDQGSSAKAKPFSRWYVHVNGQTGYQAAWLVLTRRTWHCPASFSERWSHGGSRQPVDAGS